MDLTRNDISPKKTKTVKTGMMFWKTNKNLILFIIHVLCPFLQRLIFSWKEWHPEFDPHFFMYPFLRNPFSCTLNISKNMRTTTVCWNIVVRLISSNIQDASSNIFNHVCDFLLYLLTVYISPDLQFHFYCFFYCK